MLGEQVLEVGEAKYPLRLSFEAVKRIETNIGHSLIKLDALSFFEVTVALSACADLPEDKAFEVVNEVGMEKVSILIKTLIVETFNPAKKPQAAAKEQKN